MNLQEFKSGTVDTKPWLNIVCNDLKAKTFEASDITADDITTDLLTLRNVPSVPNPPIGSVSFYSTAAGTFKGVDPLGGVVTFVTSGGPMPGVQSDGAPSIVDNFPKYVDTSGTLITDSGVGVGDVSLLQENIVALSDQAGPLAPRGQRDLWTLTSNATNNEAVAFYVESLDLLYLFSVDPGTAVSTDGGQNFGAVASYDVAPTVPFAVVGSDGSKVVGLGSAGAFESYISPDGQNFFQNPAPPTDTAESFNIEWFAAAGRYVTGVNVDATHRIMTSDEGINWVVRSSSTQALRIASNSQRCVAVGMAAPFIQWSDDGITWVDTLSTVTACRSISWNEERGLWLVLGYLDGVGYTSADGKTWTSLGVVAPGGGGVHANDHRWVSQHARYYLSAVDTDGNFSIWSTPDPRVQDFVGTHLDGASLLNPYGYSIIYMPIRDTFGLALINSPGYAFGTIRQDVKALTDNIRVRGFPVAVGCYSTYADITDDNNAAEVDISVTSSSIGSLTLQAAQPLGSRICFDLNMVVSSVAGDTLDIRYYTNAGLVFTHNLVIPALAVNLPVNINTKIIVRNGAIEINSTQTISGTVDIITATSVVYDRTLPNSWQISAQWGANVNQLRMNSLVMSTDFIAGA